jgi:hypothetical protein
VGAYRNVFARFAGGSQQCQQKNATYYGSQSAPVTIWVCLERLGKGATVLAPDIPRAPAGAR